MDTLRAWMSRLFGTFHPRRSDPDLEEELRLHVEMAAEDARRGTNSPEAACRMARIDSGGVAQAMESLRDRRGLPWLDDLRQDARYAVRTLRKTPAFSVVAILTLALGIGANTAIFSVVHAVLLHPLPFKDADRLVHLYENVPAAESPNGKPRRVSGMDVRELIELKARSRALSGPLLDVHEELRPWLAIEPPLPHVVDDANDLPVSVQSPSSHSRSASAPARRSSVRSARSSGPRCPSPDRTSCEVSCGPRESRRTSSVRT